MSPKLKLFNCMNAFFWCSLVWGNGRYLIIQKKKAEFISLEIELSIYVQDTMLIYHPSCENGAKVNLLVADNLPNNLTWEK